jgi:hypothetical protein
MPDRKGEKHPLAKLTATCVEEIKNLRAGGATLKLVGDRFGVSESQVSLIYRGKTWKHTHKNEQKNKINAGSPASAHGTVSG